MLADAYPFYLANVPQQPNRDLEVTDKYTGEVATRVALAGTDHILAGIDAAVEATRPMRRRTRSVGMGLSPPPAPIQMGMGRCTGSGLIPA